jgi:hypothetical protein
MGEEANGKFPLIELHLVPLHVTVQNWRGTSRLWSLKLSLDALLDHESFEKRLE